MVCLQIVELATLDTFNNPIDKICCLENTYELILAELKSHILYAISEFQEDCDLPEITNEIILNFIKFVIVKSKPIHFISNFYFIKYFQTAPLPGTPRRYVLSIVVYISL